MAYRTAQLRGQALGAHMRAALAARALPLPSGTANADSEAASFRRSTPDGALTRAGLAGLAMAADRLAAYYRLGRRTVDVEACLAVEQAAKMP